MEHLRQIQRAIDYIEEHLDGDLSTDSIANVAGFSKWHFQMIFSSAVGDTLKEYIRKRRLTAALYLLGNTNRRILDIALEAGFESQESFTRAFKAMFGKNPGECRSDGARSVMSLNKLKITMEYLDHLYEGINMQPVIKDIEEKKVIGVGAHFISTLSPDHTNEKVIPKLWDHYNQRRSEIKSRVSEIDLGVCLEPPEKKSHPDECFYTAGTEVRSFEDVPSGMNCIIIPAGRYAVFTHKGDLNSLPMTMKYIYGSWLPKFGGRLREAPDFEVYDKRFKPDSKDSEFDIYIPIN